MNFQSYCIYFKKSSKSAKNAWMRRSPLSEHHVQYHHQCESKREPHCSDI